MKKDRQLTEPALAIATEPDGSTLLNKCLAVIKGTLTPEGLVIDGQLVEETWISPKFQMWLRWNHLPLEFESSFAVWFRTDNKTSLIRSVSILGMRDESRNPSMSVVAGRVFKIGKKRIAVRIFPTFKNAHPFTVTLKHDGTIRVKELWAMQFECEIKDMESFMSSRRDRCAT